MTGPTILVTGAASGIGLATAHVLGRTAGRLIPVDRDADAPARQIALLLSDDAQLVTGSVLVSDGGYTL